MYTIHTHSQAHALYTVILGSQDALLLPWALANMSSLPNVALKSWHFLSGWGNSLNFQL